jgi:hypothetical protein
MNKQENYELMKTLFYTAAALFFLSFFLTINYGAQKLSSSLDKEVFAIKFAKKWRDGVINTQYICKKESMFHNK